MNLRLRQLTLEDELQDAAHAELVRDGFSVLLALDEGSKA